jgi:histidinol-phosphate phosphatase family protein
MRDWPLENEPRIRRHRAIFLDRDGTINEDTHYPHDVEDLKFVPKSLEGLELIARLPFDIIVVSNQAGIALGYFTTAQMSEFNTEIRKRVAQAKGRIDAFYYCPSLEAKNLQPGAPIDECSKPSPGMLLEAANDFDLDLSESFMIGDTTLDIAAGNRVGCRTILVHTGRAGKEEEPLPVEPTHHAKNLYDAALIIQSYLES